MALIDCPECSQPVSTQAVACPHSGAPGPASPATLPQAAPRKHSSGLWKVALFVGVLIVGGCVALFIQSIPSKPSSTTYQTPARLRLVVEQESLGYGYLKLVGTVENIGESGAYSPRLKLRVTKGDTLLAEDSTSPAGTVLKPLGPGDKAVFEFITRVPGGESSRGTSYELSAEKFAYEVKYPK